ncbi:embryonic stem cell-related gene protein-like [Macaca fascicularis]|uniref:embryonic stem cell-related gene protein-like n=1 Tax=Macaca fascicularis TaxID=9541 RepID=UPI0032B05D1C
MRMSFWCRDSDQGTSLGTSIPCPPALCSVRKIHLGPLVLRPTSPRNISLILNWRLKIDAVPSPRIDVVPSPRKPPGLSQTLWITLTVEGIRADGLK